MESNQANLIQLVSKALFGKTPVFSQLDPNRLLAEAENQAVVRLAYSALDAELLSPEELRQWRLRASMDLSKNVQVLHNHELLHEWMGDIPYVVLKGAASASYYPVPADRSMGDVDFLVPNDCLEEAGRMLERKGLAPWEEEHISHVVYRKKRMHYEMHFNLAGTPRGESGELVREYTRDIFDAATTQRLENGFARLPSPFHHGLILLLHTCHHMTGEGVGLRHLCDWAVFEDSLSDSEFREMFEEKLRAVGLWRFAQVLTRASVKYLGASEREWADCDEALADALMEDILAGGNFGKKDYERSNQAYIISSRGKNGVGNTGILRQLFVSLNDVVYTRWPFSRRWKAALPAGWLYFGVRQVFKIARGERKKIHLGKMVDGAIARRELYRQFKLFERE